MAVAGAKAYAKRQGCKGQTLVCVTSGANMNFDRLRLVSELADVGARAEAMLMTVIPEVSEEKAWEMGFVEVTPLCACRGCHSDHHNRPHIRVSQCHQHL